MFSCVVCAFFFFKQKTAYEMRISDWSSDVCSSDLWLNSHLIVGLLATFTVTTILLIYRELTHEHPIINLRLLRNPNFAVANLMIIAMGITLLGTTLLMPQFMQVLLGYSALDAGMVLAPAAVQIGRAEGGERGVQ